MDIEYSKILKAALCRGGEYADLYIEKTSPAALMFEDGKVETVVSDNLRKGAALNAVQIAEELIK